MASPTRGKVKISAEMPDTWLLKERLALACAVLKNGDQNWVSVSRTVKPFMDPDRSLEFSSQRNCAIQYAKLLENFETPKRSKRGEKEGVGESPQLQIARKLTLERVEELRDLIMAQQSEYNDLVKQKEDLDSGKIDGDTLVKMAEDLVSADDGAALKNELAVSDTENAQPQGMDPAVWQRFLDVFVLPVEQVNLSLDGDEIINSEDSKDNPVPSSPQVSKPSSPVKPSTPTQWVPPDTRLSNTPVLERFNKLLGQPSHFSKPFPSQHQRCRPPVITESTSKPDSDLGTGIASTSNSVEAAEIDANGGQETAATVEEVKTSCQESEIVVEVEVASESASNLEPDSATTDAVIAPAEPPAKVESKPEVTTGDTPVTPRPPETVPPLVIKKSAITYDPMDLDYPTAGSSPASSVNSQDTDASARQKANDFRRLLEALHITVQTNTSFRRHRLASRKHDRVSEMETTDDENSVTKPGSSGFDSVPCSPAISTGEFEMDEKSYKAWRRSIMLVWRAASVHKYANVFLHPVTEDIAPGYHSIVYRPMDLTSIKRNIENGSIKTTAEFQRDMMLMFTNAIMYNNSVHDVYHMASEMYDEVLRHIEQYVSTQVTSGGDSMTPTTSKSLRPSRRTDHSGSERSDKEDEAKKRRVSSDFDFIKKRKP